MRTWFLSLFACTLILASQARADQAFDQMMNNLNAQRFGGQSNPRQQQLNQQYQQQNPQIGPPINPNAGVPTIGPATGPMCATGPTTQYRLDYADCGSSADSNGNGGVVVPNQGVFLCDCTGTCTLTACVEP